MDRHIEFRLDELTEKLDLLRAGVTRCMQTKLNAVVYDLDAVVRKLVDYSADKLFIAGDRARREDNDIVCSESYIAVISKCHSVERAHRLTLTSGRDYCDLTRSVMLDLGYVDYCADRGIHISELYCGGYHGLHTSSRQRYVSSMAERDVDYLLNAVNV